MKSRTVDLQARNLKKSNARACELENAGTTEIEKSSQAPRINSRNTGQDLQRVVSNGISNLQSVLPEVFRNINTIAYMTQDLPNWMSWVNSVIIPLAQSFPTCGVTYNGFYCSVKILSHHFSREQIPFNNASKFPQQQDAYCGMRISVCTGELVDHKSNTSKETSMFCLEVEFNGHIIDLNNNNNTSADGWPCVIYLPNLPLVIEKIEEFKDYLSQHATPDFVRDCYSLLPADSVLQNIQAQFGDNVQIIGPFVF